MSSEDLNNVISEWFGHRVFPKVVLTPQSLGDMRARRCPFLSLVKTEPTECIKPENAKGVCTISASSNGPRQDWVACPYRVFDPSLIDAVVARLYPGTAVLTFAAPRLSDASTQEAILSSLRAKKRVLVYFDQKIGGEISLSATMGSPEMAFDVTFVELLLRDESLTLGKFGIVEVQTMDFHGSYKKAVLNMKSGLDLHPRDFPATLRRNQWWASEGIEGPNIANVFKRTFYQMMFKFSFGVHDACAGTALMISSSVWDSWQPFLGAPKLVPRRDGTWRLRAPHEAVRPGRAGSVGKSGRVPAWIYVFDMDSDAKRTPSPMILTKVIGLTADALGHYALSEAPANASRQLLSERGIYATLKRRIESHWKGQSLKLTHDVAGSEELEPE
jgi:hypothetical protein